MEDVSSCFMADVQRLARFLWDKGLMLKREWNFLLNNVQYVWNIIEYIVKLP